MDEIRKNLLLANIKTSIEHVNEAMLKAHGIAEKAASEGKLSEYDLETMLETTEHFLIAAQQIQLGAAGASAEGAKDAKDPAA